LFLIGIPHCFATSILLGHADYDSAPARQFVLGDLSHELQIETQALAFLPSRIVKKVNDITTEAVFDSAARFQVERTGRIHFLRFV
jgi:hypothetical protein